MEADMTGLEREKVCIDTDQCHSRRMEEIAKRVVLEPWFGHERGEKLTLSARPAVRFLLIIIFHFRLACQVLTALFWVIIHPCRKFIYFFLPPPPEGISMW